MLCYNSALNHHSHKSFRMATDPLMKWGHLVIMILPLKIWFVIICDYWFIYFIYQLIVWIYLCIHFHPFICVFRYFPKTDGAETICAYQKWWHRKLADFFFDMELVHRKVEVNIEFFNTYHAVGVSRRHITNFAKHSKMSKFWNLVTIYRFTHHEKYIEIITNIPIISLKFHLTCTGPTALRDLSKVPYSRAQHFGINRASTQDPMITSTLIHCATHTPNSTRW